MSPRRREAPPGPTEAARLADDLRGRILSGELTAGTPLREQAIAADENLSRHTVRTALARLTAERLVIQEPYRGIRVTSFTAEDVRGLYELRCALEAEAVRFDLRPARPGLARGRYRAGSCGRGGTGGNCPRAPRGLARRGGSPRRGPPGDCGYRQQPPAAGSLRAP